MRFWDSSAIIPLIVNEPKSASMRQLLAGDESIATSSITPIEIASVLWRRRHAGQLDFAAHQHAEVTFADLSVRWTEIAHTPLIVQAAIDLVSRRPLRSLDAIQLASAIILSDTPAQLMFITLDRNLAAAAAAEGFAVLP